MAATKIILASGSPRRRAMLAWTGRSCDILDLQALRALAIDETPFPGEEPPLCVMRLAQSKARAATHLVSENDVILSADTVVALDGFILGKPADSGEARRMLVHLRGKVHHVFTALALLEPKSGKLWTEICNSPVWMRNYSEEELDAYVNSGDPLDKAGAYAIQHPNFQPALNFQHCFASVMGMPLCHLERCLRAAGIPPVDGVPQRCQFELAYTCPIFESILPPLPVPPAGRPMDNRL